MVMVAEIIASCGLVGLWGSYYRLYNKRMDEFKSLASHIAYADPLPDDVSYTVIVPVYNEEHNVVACAKAAMDSTRLDAKRFRVVIVDDLSTDNTVAEITKFRDALPKSEQDRLKIVSAGPRPTTETWLGKTWACVQGFKHAEDLTYAAFIDADVRIKPFGLDKAVSVAHKEGLALISG
eukprot:PhM_4_TR15951/c0_g1_i3/m.102790